MFDTLRPVLVSFRDDLRVSDNPSLDAAARSGRRLICVYVHDEESDRVANAARSIALVVAWLSSDPERYVGKTRRQTFAVGGAASRLIAQLAEQCDAGAVVWNRRYGAAERPVDQAFLADLKAVDIATYSFNGYCFTNP